MKYDKKKKITIITCLVALVICLGIGFAAFSTTLRINGSAQINPNADNFKIVFASGKSEDTYLYEEVEATTIPDGLETHDGEIDNNDVPTISNLHVTFTEDNQSATYDFLVANIGKYDAYLTSVITGSKTCTPGEGADPTLVREACQDIKLEVTIGSGDNQIVLNNTQEIENHILRKGESEPVKVEISYPEGSTLPDGEMEVTFADTQFYMATQDDTTIVQDDVYEQLKAKGDHYLMASNNNSAESKIFRFNNVKAKNIVEVNIVPNLDIPEDTIEVADLSKDQDGSVMGWAVHEPGTSYDEYKLYIGADGLVTLTDGNSLFAYYYRATKFDLTYLDTSKAELLCGMFANTSADEIDLSHFDTSNVKAFNSMFAYSTFKHLDLSSFDTTSAIDMSYMFLDCENLESINLSSFNTTNVTDMSYMFSGCHSLKEIDLRNFDTSNVENMEFMFSGSWVIKNLDLSNFDTRKVKKMSGMFLECLELENLNLSSFTTDNLEEAYTFILEDEKLKSIDLRNFELIEGICNDTLLIISNHNFKLTIKDTQNNKNIINTTYPELTNVEYV